MFVAFTGTPLGPRMDGWPPWTMVRNLRIGVAALWIDIAINMRPSCDLNRIFSSLSLQPKKPFLSC